MTRQINDQEFAQVTALPAAERYAHFVAQVADWEQVWSLRGPDGWALLGDQTNRELVPVWPHARYAEAFANTGQFAGSVATPIALDVWLERWLPGIATDGRGVAVFPVAPCAAIAVSAEQLHRDLETELKAIE